MGPTKIERLSALISQELQKLAVVPIIDQKNSDLFSDSIYLSIIKVGPDTDSVELHLCENLSLRQIFVGDPGEVSFAIPALSIGEEGTSERIFDALYNRLNNILLHAITEITSSPEEIELKLGELGLVGSLPSGEINRIRIKAKVRIGKLTGQALGSPIELVKFLPPDAIKRIKDLMDCDQ